MKRTPLPTTECGHCGQVERCKRTILDQPVCPACELRFRRAPRRCPHCAQPKVLAFHDNQNRPACASCTGNDPIYACPRCGSEDKHYGRLCAACTLHDRAAELLADLSGHIHPQLQPVFDAWMTAKDPRSTLQWFNKPSSSPEILRAMAIGELPISHATFDNLPSTRAVNYIRDLLTATGVLEPYQPLIARTTHWLNEILQLLPKHHADLIHRFAQWHLLRRLRHLEAQDKVTRGSVQHARATIITAIRLLIWLDEYEIDLADMTQDLLDAYLAEYPGRGSTLARFIEWTNNTHLTDNLRIPPPHRPDLQVRLSDDQRWAYVETLLHNDSIRRYTRIAGLFMLLFAQPLSRICRMRHDQIALQADGTVTTTFDTVAIEMPEPLDQLLRDHLTDTGPASYANHGIWLFPGRLPGKALVTENIRAELVAHGIRPHHARHAALFHLAADMPTPVLAELLGIAPITATRWAALSARTWSQYTAMRYNNQL
ncbi:MULTISPECIES: hypothetical protein [Nocardia]|jgi:hypothetical protein|uniref:hypothetical protein n=1 Tax=Nocardia TaxID=1817 RepID=UPI0009ED76B9|nr:MULTISPECIES: hypothetical protein [Nocardia]MCC3311418.1 hypothetical protein [Nocardia africana]MCC3318270.1 hypothetical protein [Nocardia africana]